MGLKTEGEQVVHRPGPLKQSNKKHKGGKTRSTSLKGRVDAKTISRKNRLDLNRAERKNQANQLRKNKRDAVVSKKRGFGSASSAPILVAIIPLGYSSDPLDILKRLETCTEGLEVSYNDYGHCHIRSPQQKQRFTFFIPRFSNLHEVMDATKVADRILFLHSENEYDDYTEMLLSVILSHALPASVHVLPGLEKLPPKKKSEVKKDVLKKIESKFPDEKLFHADTRQEMQLILRQIGLQKGRSVGFRDARPHVIAEKFEFIDKNLETGTGTLKVYGYIRGKALDVNSLVHIPGFGNFQMSQIQYEQDPCSPPRKASSSKDEAMTDSTTLVAEPSLQQSLQSEVIPDPMESVEASFQPEEVCKPRRRKRIKKVAEGTSDYQAAWLVGSDVEVEEVTESEGSDDESDADSLVTADEDFPPEDDPESMESMDEEGDEGDYEIAKESEDPQEYDKDINMEEEKKMLVRFKEERMERMFPDEVDTPIDLPARVRYKKYRGLENFVETPWDPMEDLPPDYGRIYRFENFRLTKKKVFATEEVGATCGSYVSINILNVPLSIIEEGNALVLFGMLQHEQKMSVVNALIRKHPSCEIPVKSKDNLIFHVGFRRFVCQPVFSVNSNGNKFKFEKFLPSGSSVIASFFAPVTFPPASVTVFYQKPDGQVQLVATGSIFNVDPNRVIIKRIVLSGHPFKIFKRFAVVRYMFFNRDDINWFKTVELHTKCGRKGHIKEPLGSHGHMKCVFDRQLQSQDTVLMTLYKRVFPKWTCDSDVPTPVSPYENNESMLI